MREIKFRAWDKQTNKWLKQGSYVIGEFRENKLAFCEVGNQDGRKLTYPSVERENKIILMQYTGLKDRYGKEIWEGDIIKGLYNYSEKYGVVKWFDKFAGFGFTVDYWGSSDFNFKANDCYKYKVIGNIYEHPELLTK